SMKKDLKDDLPIERDARSLMDPDRSPVLTRDEKWVMKPTKPFNAGDRRFHGFLPPGWPRTTSMPEGHNNPDCDDFFNGYALTRFVRYVAWAYLDLPGDHPARNGARRMAELIRKRLENPDLLILAGLVDLSTMDDPSEVAKTIVDRFVGKPYGS